jgi:hypothetical protein
MMIMSDYCPAALRILSKIDARQNFALGWPGCWLLLHAWLVMIIIV